MTRQNVRCRLKVVLFARSTCLIKCFSSEKHLHLMGHYVFSFTVCENFHNKNGSKLELEGMTKHTGAWVHMARHVSNQQIYSEFFNNYKGVKECLPYIFPLYKCEVSSGTVYPSASSSSAWWENVEVSGCKCKWKSLKR